GRPGVDYGPRDRHNSPQVSSAITRHKFAYLGSRVNVVLLVHVIDVVPALRLAADKPVSRGRVYQITDGSHTTIGELIDLLANLSGSSRPERVLPYLVPYLGCLRFEWLRRSQLDRGRAPIARNR